MLFVPLRGAKGGEDARGAPQDGTDRGAPYRGVSFEDEALEEDRDGHGAIVFPGAEADAIEAEPLPSDPDPPPAPARPAADRFQPTRMARPHEMLDPEDGDPDGFDVHAFLEALPQAEPPAMGAAGADGPQGPTVARRSRADPVPRIDDFDVRTDDLEVSVAEGAPGEVLLRRDEDGVTVIVDGKAVAFLGGLSRLDPERVRVRMAG